MEIDYDQYYPHWIEEFKRCAPWIEGALEYTGGDFNLKDVADGISRGQYMLWSCETAVMITEFARSPQQTILHLFLAGGDMDGVKELVNTIEKWAVEIGCHRITLTGREGWKKSFVKSLGYTEVSVHMSKRLK